MLAVVEALLPQVDDICVWLNGYDAVPEELAGRDRVVVRLGEDVGDRGKFAFLDGFDGLYLSVDDDITYPAFYVEHCLAGIEKYADGVIVGWHGSLLAPDITDFYEHSKREVFNFGRDLAADTAVDVLGTGAAAFLTSTLPLRTDAFVAPNMADIFFALQARTAGVPLVALAHAPGWATDIVFPRNETIWGASVNRAGGAYDTGATTAALLPDLLAQQRQPLPPPAPRPALDVAVAGPGAPDVARELRWAWAPLGVRCTAAAPGAQDAVVATTRRAAAAAARRTSSPVLLADPARPGHVTRLRGGVLPVPTPHSRTPSDPTIRRWLAGGAVDGDRREAARGWATLVAAVAGHSEPSGRNRFRT